MGKGYLTPDTRTLEDCQVPVFKTHPTPVNVSLKPSEKARAAEGGVDMKKKGVHRADPAVTADADRAGTASSPSVTPGVAQGCCLIL